jgi:ferrous iron transport protein A
MGNHGAIPLAIVSPGETVQLVEIQGGHRLKKRLADLGLNAGMTVRVVRNDSTGPLILAVKHDSRLALGRGMAYKIQVALPKGRTPE